MDDEKILELDLSEIYLGNLGTVDTDLVLPKTGKRGSEFKWASGEILFISHKGEVTRPSFGVGNREVTLTVNGTYNNLVMEKQFIVTVLEELQQRKIIKVIDLEIESINGIYSLPSVCVVELDDHSFTTAEVSWLETNDSHKNNIVKGIVKDTDLPVYAKIYPTKEISVAEIELAVSKPVELLGDTIYKQSQERILEHLKDVDIDQLLYSFREVAELDRKGSLPMTGWDAPECNLKGHTTGHYLSAFSFALYATNAEVFRQKIEYLVDELEKCQKSLEAKGMSKGFLSAYSEEQFDLLEIYTTYPTIWAPYYTLDKILNGLLDAYEYGKNEKAIIVAKDIGEWVSNRLGKLPKEQLKKMWSIYIAGEFGAMITALIRLYKFTDEVRFKDTALLFENDKLFIPAYLNYDTLNGVHANQHIPQIIGAMDIYEVTKNPKYLVIAENFWTMVVNNHSYSIGGVGETEMFKEKDQIANYLTSKTAESCASHNMLKLTKKLFDVNPKAKYFNYYENTLHNHLLSAASFGNDGGTTYFMPTLPGGQKKFDTFENTCCHGSGLETLLRFQKDIYTFKDKICYVNLFYDSKVSWKEKNIDICMNVTDKDVTLYFEGSADVEMYIRKPEWLNFININADSMNLSNESEYIVLKGKVDDSVIRLEYEQKNRIIYANNDKTVFSIFYGLNAMVCCDSDTNFIEISEEVLTNIVADSQNLHIKGKELKPLNLVNHENYHLYFKKM